METKLRLILKRIHWSLALKAAILAVVWMVLPGWAFLILSAYLYFVPFFDPWKLFLPFLVFLFLAFTGPPNPGFALILGSLFYVILGIKDLILIDRRSAYDIMILISLFLPNPATGRTSLVILFIFHYSTIFSISRDQRPHWTEPRATTRNRKTAEKFINILSRVTVPLR